MNETIVEWLTTGIELLLTSLLIVGLISVGSASQSLNSKVLEQQAMGAELKAYREHNQFDNTHVYQQDIISAIFKGRGSPGVYVKSSKGDYVWTLSNTPCDYTTAEISLRIDPAVLYDSALRRGMNGEVIAYEFVPHSAGCGR